MVYIGYMIICQFGKTSHTVENLRREKHAFVHDD